MPMPLAAAVAVVKTLLGNGGNKLFGQLSKNKRDKIGKTIVNASI